MMRKKVFPCCMALVIALSASLWAAAPPLRDEVSLNGVWRTEDGEVEIPQYFGADFTGKKTFVRQVAIPDNWAGKRVKLTFNQIAHQARFLVNDRLVHEQLGGWAQFDVDVTDHVIAGKTFDLKVEILGSDAVKNERGMLTHPVGNWMTKAGIQDDVWLRAYGPVHIDDTFVKTSYRHREIRVVYTVRNTSDAARTITIVGQARRPPRPVAKTVEVTATLAPGEVRELTAAAPWADAELYWPDDPRLYHLESEVRSDGQVVDRETRRFGFREIWTESNRIYWNGVRTNLYGDYQSINTSGYHTDSSDLSRAGWPATVDAIRAMNVRCLRFHHQPVPLYLLETAEEKGLLICSEAPNYARNYHAAMNDEERWRYVENFNAHVAPGWIRRERNFACIYIFNATNEMTYNKLGEFSVAQCRAMGAAIRKLDGTRLVGYDGDANYGVAEDTRNVHYPNGYNTEPTGSIYSMDTTAEGRRRVDVNIPTGVGEMLHTHDSALLGKPEYISVIRNRWWLAFWLRGLRYTDWTDVRPACYWYAANDLAGRPSRGGDPGHGIRGTTLKNALAPVALFDKQYDDLGLAPYVGDGIRFVGRWPTVASRSTLIRTLVLYNDEFRGEHVTAEVLVKIGAETLATGSSTLDVPLGERRELHCEFVVPDQPGKTLTLVLRARKGGQLRFEEERWFLIESAAPSSPSTDLPADAVRLTPLP